MMAVTSPKVKMNRFEKILVVLLRVGGVVLLTALVPAIMPLAWMKAIHRLMGMGELPGGTIVGYLTRSLSLLYAFHGALAICVSLDVRRYLPLVKYIALLNIAFGVVLLVLDVILGMPLPWTLCEGPSIMILGGGILWLVGRIPDAARS
jgi:hypothetical protein